MVLLLTSSTKLHKEGGATQIRCAAERKGEAAIANGCMYVWSLCYVSGLTLYGVKSSHLFSCMGLTNVVLCWHREPISISKTTTIELCLYFSARSSRRITKLDQSKQPNSLTRAASIRSFLFFAQNTTLIPRRYHACSRQGWCHHGRLLVIIMRLVRW